MGKNKNKEKKSNKKFNDNDEEASDFERLNAYAEKTGRNIWEVTLMDLEDRDNDDNEEEELESNDETEKKEQNISQLDKKKEYPNTPNQDAMRESVDNLLSDQTPQPISSITNINEQVITYNLNNPHDLLEDEIDLDLEKLEIKSATVKEDEYPLYEKINNEITKIIHLDSENHQIVDQTKNGVLNVKFGNTKVIFEYPKEDTSQKPNQNKIKKKKVSESDSVVVEKKDKKKKNSDQLDDIGQEDLIRLEEAKRKREEYAYLEKCRLEEEEIRKQENAHKLLEESKKQKDKNKFKPKPKKKKGK